MALFWRKIGAKCLYIYVAFCLHATVSLAETPLIPAKLLPENLQFHGFMSQAFFHSSGNNVYGQSKDGISPGMTEIGLNLNYQPINELRFAAQGLYRRAGGVDPGSLRLDYGLVDFTMIDYGNTLVGLSGGRVKIPFGLYNETRDVSFTHPTILLPQGIYFDRSRSLLMSADGASLYAQQRTDFGNFNLRFNVGMPSNDLQEIKTVLLGTARARGTFHHEPAIAAQLNYELDGGKYVFAISYMNLHFDYSPAAGEDIPHHSSQIQPLLFSAQYNGENFTLTGEYAYRWNNFGRYGAGNKFVSESWYVEASYRILPQLQASVRYDTFAYDISDRGGDGAARFGLPRSVQYAKDWVFGLRWDITSNWMLRGDYSRVHGTAWLPYADNPDPTLHVQDWDLFGLQLSFKF